MRGSDFLSRTRADQNPEDLRRERRDTGKGSEAAAAAAMVAVVVVMGRREDRQSERGNKKGRGEGELQTDRCFSWSARKSKA